MRIYCLTISVHATQTYATACSHLYPGHGEVFQKIIGRKQFKRLGCFRSKITMFLEQYIFLGTIYIIVVQQILPRFSRYTKNTNMHLLLLYDSGIKITFPDMTVQPIFGKNQPKYSLLLSVLSHSKKNFGNIFKLKKVAANTFYIIMF